MTICGTCRFWDRLGNTFDGNCCRYPPRLFVIPMDVEAQDPIDFTWFPSTESSQWCGEYKAKEDDTA